MAVTAARGSRDLVLRGRASSEVRPTGCCLPISWQGGAVALKNPAQINQMRPAGKFVAGVLSSLRDVAREGMTLKQLDTHAHQMIDAAGAHSVYLGYHPSFGAMPYPGVLCTSVNDAALHGLPSDYVLADGDVLSIDFAAQLQGWVADSALTFQIGTQDPAVTAAHRDHRAGARRRHRGRAARRADGRHLVGHRHHRARRRVRDQRRLRRARRRPDHARGPARAQPRPPRHRASSSRPAWSSRSSRGSWRVATTTRSTRRLDHPHRRRLAGRPRRAHGRDHPGRPAGPHGPRLTARATSEHMSPRPPSARTSADSSAPTTERADARHRRRGRPQIVRPATGCADVGCS